MMKTIGKLALVVLAFVLLINLMLWITQRQESHLRERENRLRDSISVLEGEVLSWRRVDKERTAALVKSTELLDQVLQKPPRIIYVTRRDTQFVVTDTGPQSQPAVNIPYVPKEDYDTLASRCSVVRKDCAASVAVKDSIIGMMTIQLGAFRQLGEVRDRELKVARRSSLLRRVSDATIGGLVGAASAGLVCTVTR